MGKHDHGINRRLFLKQAASFCAGIPVGLMSCSHAMASQGEESRPGHHARIAIIIDDIGFSHSRLQSFLDLGIPLTFAILPRLDLSVPLAEEISANGHEIMLHQPMEPIDPQVDPGPGALYVGDRPQRINAVLEENISSIPAVVGVNNHMGSKFTAHAQSMIEALTVVKERNLFFIDSLTSSRSTAFRTAKQLNIVSGFRNVFLDVYPTEERIFGQLQRLTQRARRYGHAIGIGHPYPETTQALQHFFRGTQTDVPPLVPVSGLISSKHGGAATRVCQQQNTAAPQSKPSVDS